MNFKKLLIVVAAVVVVIVTYKLMTGIDHDDPVEVASAFTKAYKSRDIDRASKYYLPDKAEAWRTSTTAKLDGLKRNATDMYFDVVPDDPKFTAASTAAGGVTVVQSADKAFTLEMTQLDGRWYVSKSPI